MFKYSYTKKVGNSKRDDDMRPESSPEKVWVMARWVARHTQPIPRATLFSQLTMDDVTGKGEGGELPRILQVSKELGLVDESEGMVSLALEPIVVNDPKSFRLYVQRQVFSRPQSLFYQTTQRYLRVSDEVGIQTSFSDVRKVLDADGSLDLTDHDIRGWRFWVSYLGVGYLQSRYLLPNSYVRVRDALSADSELPREQWFPMDQFMSWLDKTCPEHQHAAHRDTRLGLSLSNALRTMEAMGFINWRRQPDAMRWQLIRYDAEDLNELSHIQIAGGQK